MSAALSHSIAALLPPEYPAAQQAALLAVSRACPGLVFYDQLGARVVRVADGRLTSHHGDAPPHVGSSITRDERERFWLFEDHGDVWLPGWSPAAHAIEVELASHSRVLGDLDQLATLVADALDNDELPADDAAFLRVVKAAIVVARAERLPIVAHW